MIKNQVRVDFDSTDNVLSRFIEFKVVLAFSSLFLDFIGIKHNLSKTGPQYQIRVKAWLY